MKRRKNWRQNIKEIISINDDQKIIECSKALDEAHFKLHELMSKDDPLHGSISQREAIDRYNQYVKAVKDYADAERRLILNNMCRNFRTI